MNFYLDYLGCKVNGYEVDAVKAAFLKEGYVASETPEDVDILLLNTCSVTSTSDQKSRQRIRKLRRLSPNAILIVMGCYSEKHAEETASFGANIVLGTFHRHKIVSYIKEYKEKGETIIDADKKGKREYEEFPLLTLSSKERAYLKIQDGCDSYCSYCLIPSLRGPSRSREKDKVLEEVKVLSKISKEIVITGIHIGYYGKDLRDGKYRLSDLLEDILRENPELFRLRISSLESSEIDDKLISLFEKHPSLASHLHLPLQSGSPEILKKMHRKYDGETFLENIDKLRKVRPDIAITTDVIVGYPGESEEDFLATMDFCEKAKFAEIHVFPFSARAGTYAATLKDTPSDIKKERVARLLALSKKLRKEYEDAYIGKSLEILFESYDENKKVARGHSSNYLLVDIPSRRDLKGEVLPVIYDDENRAD